ncbi:MAG: VOC family protein, partial [Methylobacter sp.]
MRYLHTMVRVRDLNESLDFYCNKLGLVESNRGVAIFAKAFLGIPAQQAAKNTRPLMPAAAPAVLR